MIFQGRIHRFGDHVDTDEIIPSAFLGRTDPESLAKGCFNNVRPGFAEQVEAGDILVAGENFGCGSSREHAPIAIKATGIGCVIAASFSRIFYRSAINIGLPIAICPEAIQFAVEGASAQVDFDGGTVSIAGQRFPIPAFPPEVMEILKVGGLVPFMAHRLKRQGAIA